MKKSSTVGALSKRNFDQKLTIGLDLGDRSNWYCVLDEAGEVINEKMLATFWNCRSEKPMVGANCCNHTITRVTPRRCTRFGSLCYSDVT
jgi:hypothetical protein